MRRPTCSSSITSGGSAGWPASCSPPPAAIRPSTASTPYLAFYHSPAEGFRIFPIGDFEEYRLVSQQPGRVVITVRQTSHTGGSNPFKTSARRLTITWPLRGETIPDTITVTDAR
jgi:hypothetical protein